MSVTSYRKLTQEQIEERIAKQKDKLAKLRFEINTGKDQDTSQLGKIKKEIAKLKTVKNEKIFIKGDLKGKDIESKNSQTKNEDQKKRKDIKKSGKRIKKDKEDKKEPRKKKSKSSKKSVKKGNKSKVKNKVKK